MMDPRLASATEPRPIPSTSSQPKRSPGKQLQWRFLALPRPIFFPGDLLSMSTHMEAGRKQAETQNQQRDRALAQGASIQPTDPPNRGNTRSLHQFFSTDAEVKTRILVNRSPSVLRLLTCCCCLWEQSGFLQARSPPTTMGPATFIHGPWPPLAPPWICLPRTRCPSSVVEPSLASPTRPRRSFPSNS